jgi:hypothetical protein
MGIVFQAEKTIFNTFAHLFKDIKQIFEPDEYKEKNIIHS